MPVKSAPMHVRRGKPLDSSRLKRDLDKSVSVVEAGAFSREIRPEAAILRCPVCDNENASDLSAVHGFLYRECLGCGTAFVVNPPSREDIEGAYRSDYYTKANKVLLANERTIDYRLDAVARPKVRFAVDHLTTERKTWLDVGCGVGEILGAVREHGFKTLGLETNAMEADYARRKFGLEIREEYVSNETLPRYKGLYGVISMFSVLEHVLDPDAILRTIAQAQDVGDNIVIETPHYPSISSYSQMVFPDHVNRMMHPPLHLFLFSMKALELMLKRSGYRITAAWYFGQDFYEFLSTLGLFHTGLNGSKLHSALAGMTNDLQKVIDDHGFSDEVLLIAEKVA